MRFTKLIFKACLVATGLLSAAMAQSQQETQDNVQLNVFPTPRNAGYYQCPSGKIYAVADNNDGCRSLAGTGGKMINCTSNNRFMKSRDSVACGSAPAGTTTPAQADAPKTPNPTVAATTAAAGATPAGKPPNMQCPADLATIVFKTYANGPDTLEWRAREQCPLAAFIAQCQNAKGKVYAQHNGEVQKTWPVGKELGVSSLHRFQVVYSCGE